MIPIDTIVPENLYSQDDAPLLLGHGFSEDAAREAICEACRSGQLESRGWRRRYWFTGRQFFAWVARWSGADIRIDTVVNEEDTLAQVLPLRQNGEADPEPARRPGGR